MRVNETSAQKRIWALVLTVMMVIGLLPFNVVAADEVVTAEEPAEGQGSALYGTVTALTGEEYNIVGEVDIEGNETESVTVTMTKMKLKCVLEDPAIGRPMAGGQVFEWMLRTGSLMKWSVWRSTRQMAASSRASWSLRMEKTGTTGSECGIS